MQRTSITENLLDSTSCYINVSKSYKYHFIKVSDMRL